jgi:hypothetical protein
MATAISRMTGDATTSRRLAATMSKARLRREPVAADARSLPPALTAESTDDGPSAGSG